MLGKKRSGPGIAVIKKYTGKISNEEVVFRLIKLWMSQLEIKKSQNQ